MAREVFHSNNLVSAARKIVSGQVGNLNFGEVRDLGIKLGKSWERELELSVDATVSCNVGLSLQFFQDGHGPKLGYEGAIRCLESYVGQACAPLLTPQGIAKLRVDWKAIGVSIRKACKLVEVETGDGSYTRFQKQWYSTMTGQMIRPVNGDGTAMTDAEFKALVDQLDALAKQKP